MDDQQVLEVLRAAAVAVRRALDDLDDWGPAGTRAGQYRSDLAADEACLRVLDDAGFGWLSEESGIEHGDRDVLVVVDPVDGSTNAARGVPWYATSLCALDEVGPRAALVVNQATGRRYEAVAGGGATRDGQPIRPSAVMSVDDAIIGLSGYPPRIVGRQFRAFGAAALDLCAVADGTLDGYVDCSPRAHGVWDYAGATLVCAEAGVGVVDAFAHPLVVRDHAARRTPVAGASAALRDRLVAYRRSFALPGDPEPVV